jgi:flagellar basal body-associated protein FliL
VAPVGETESAPAPLHPRRATTKGGNEVSILWIILIVVLVLALLGFFSRGYW